MFREEMGRLRVAALVGGAAALRGFTAGVLLTCVTLAGGAQAGGLTPNGGAAGLPMANSLEAGGPSAGEGAAPAFVADGPVAGGAGSPLWSDASGPGQGLRVENAAPLPLGAAGPVRTLGRARLFTNDYLGDGHDRWRTGSYQFSLLRGAQWDGRPPAEPFALMEYRFRSALIAAQRVTRVGGATQVDRPHVGELSFGLHSHARIGGTDLAFGLDLVALGPQTGMARAQRAFHERFGFDGPYGTEIAVADALRLQGRLELLRLYPLGARAALRPFAEVSLGVEDRATLGADLFIGRLHEGALFTRDVTTGHPVLAVAGPERGLTLTLGADVTAVGKSLYLPEGYAAEDLRLRARAGLHWQINPRASLFYGLSWHGAEFVGQPEGQWLGALRLALRF